MDAKNTIINIKKLLKSSLALESTPKEQGAVVFCKVSEIFREKEGEKIIFLDFKDFPNPNYDLFLGFLCHIYAQDYTDEFLDSHLRFSNLSANAHIDLEEAWSEAFKLTGRTGGFF